MYITEWGNDHISIFTTNGHFVRSYGGQGNSVGQFNLFVSCDIVCDCSLIVTVKMLLLMFRRK